MPVDGRLAEMKSAYHADVEAAEVRSLLTRRHVHAGYFRQVLVTGGDGRLSTQMADWNELRGDQEQYECPSEWSSCHVMRSEKGVHSRQFGAQVRLTPWFGCKHCITIAAKPHPKSACQMKSDC
jgi:hypothetical protein